MAATIVAWRWWNRPPPPPPHPLTLIEAADITAVQIFTPDGPQPLTGPALARAAAAIAALKSAPQIDSQAVTWGSATLLRATTRDGIALSLQAKPVAEGVAVRVTADSAADAAGRADARSIRTLRLNAYRLSSDIAAPLLAPPTPAAGN